ncbi:hypothetical protein BDV12DRAFT_77964 [Aspergillus spectabilis]
MSPTTTPPHGRHKLSNTPSRARSRSPTRRSHEDGKNRHREDSDRDRVRERRHRHRDSHSYRRNRDRDHDRTTRPEPIPLPFQSRALKKRDLEIYEPIFSMYLDIQKGLILEDLDAEEVKGRWKSFVGKW